MGNIYKRRILCRINLPIHCPALVSMLCGHRKISDNAALYFLAVLSTY